MDVIENMKREMFRRKLSPRTIKTYLEYVRKFLLFCKKEPKKFSKVDIKYFLDQYACRGASGNTINVVNNALRFMMVEVLRKSLRLNIRYSKKPKCLPTVLTKEEALMLINSITNAKHRLMVSLMYGAGLRVSEVLKLKKENLDLENNFGWVRRGKGNKDRPFIIPLAIKNELYNHLNNIDSYLFKGRNNGPLSVKSAQVIVEKAAKKAEINKNVHPHTLRHSFATHLIESGNSLTAVQSLMGHSEARTTMTYIHLAAPKLINIKSPLDEI